MGITESILGKLELEDGTEVIIEKHESGGIQMNIGNVSFGFKEEEFIQFADAVEEGQNELINIKEGL